MNMNPIDLLVIQDILDYLTAFEVVNWHQPNKEQVLEFALLHQFERMFVIEKLRDGDVESQEQHHEDFLMMEAKDWS